MNLFLDAISPKNILILFDDEKNIIKEYFFDVKQNESTMLIEEIDNFLKTNNISYFDLENIVVVNGPGSFTGVRTTTLLINTINFITGKSITPLTYFDLFKNCPIVKSSSKRDSFLKIDEMSEIEIIQNEELEKKLKNISKIYGDITFLTDKEILSDANYKQIIQNLKFQNNQKIESYYIKKPSIS